MPETKWYNDHKNVAAFLEVLLESDVIDVEQDEILYMLNQPWKYNEEYIAWDEAGRPMPNDSSWDGYLDSLENE